MKITLWLFPTRVALLWVKRSKHKYFVLATRIGYNPILAGFHISISFQLWVIPLFAAILYAKWYLEKILEFIHEFYRCAF